MLLAQHKNKIFTLENLYESIWHESYDSSKSSQYIKNVWGRGYCIEEDK
ncbi:winged helix-turn-helix domain-containing protein [Thomasclavelia spiroformis]|nr:winged helix-turn-helix domain-containing protein [Thomasclavelia spiroformis]